MTTERIRELVYAMVEDWSHAVCESDDLTLREYEDELSKRAEELVECLTREMDQTLVVNNPFYEARNQEHVLNPLC